MRTLLKAVLGIALLLGILQSSCSVRFEVKDDTGKTCILADLSINFTVEYKTDKQAFATFALPNTAVVGNTSSCGKAGVEPLLVITFESGHNLRINFNKTDKEYFIDQLLFNYNLSDKTYFHGSTENGTKQVSTNKTEISAETNHVYQCASPHLISMENVNATFHNVKLEAYLSGSNYSKDVTICKEDMTPTTTPHTSAHTSAPTTAPVNPKTPETGFYVVNVSGIPCIMARMGLQLNITYKKKDDKNTSYSFNIPKDVPYNGTCGQNYSTLLLASNTFSLLFNFTLNNTEGKFYLGRVHLGTTIPDPEAKDPSLNVESGNLSYLQTTTHKSYKCNAKQTFTITDSVSIDTYNLQIQAFDIDGNKFGPVVECADDQNGMLVPIIVGAALAVLVLIVLVAYLIGRKRSHAGYQTI